MFAFLRNYIFALQIYSYIYVAAELDFVVRERCAVRKLLLEIIWEGNYSFTLLLFKKFGGNSWNGPMIPNDLSPPLQELLGHSVEADMRGGTLYSERLVHYRRAGWKGYAKPKVRSVWSPSPQLKAVQRRIHQLVSARFEPHPIAHAYTRGRSVVTNARQHVQKEWLLHLDVLNFFGSIREPIVREALALILPEFCKDDVRLIADRSCYKGRLPQGSPSSPVLSNLVCHPLDVQLQEFASSLGLTVTRYSDDICFSSSNASMPNELATVQGSRASQQIKLGPRLSRLFEQHGFRMNVGKLRFQSRAERQIVTGLVVNDRVNVPSEYYRAVRAVLHFLEPVRLRRGGQPLSTSMVGQQVCGSPKRSGRLHRAGDRQE